MSEKIFTILATGTFPAASPRPDWLPAGVTLDIIPFISTRPRTGSALSARIGALSRLPVNAVFTSAEAVRAVMALCAVPPSWSVSCLSGPTQAAITAWLGSEACVLSAPDAASLAEKIVSAGMGDHVFFCGNQRRDVLPVRLKTEHISLEEIIVYESAATPVRLEKNYDALLFFSPTAVVSFFSMNRIPGQTAVFALGHTTAAELEQRIPGNVIISQQPNKILLLQTAVDFAHANRIL